jgi:hypothetical protein
MMFKTAHNVIGKLFAPVGDRRRGLFGDSNRFDWMRDNIGSSFLRAAKSRRRVETSATASERWA